MSDPKQFWEDKILAWEQGRYSPGDQGGPLERLADRASDSLRFRLHITGELLAPLVQGKAVLDIGCGSGRLAGALLAAGARSYRGIDIAAAAIDEARQRATREGWDRARFELGTVHRIERQDADIVVSLGLTDWLTDAELAVLFERCGDADFLHAISEKRNTPAQWIHRSYVWLAYGHRTGAYVPRYFSPGFLADFARPHHPGPFRVWRHRRLSFGALVTSLSFGEPL